MTAVRPIAQLEALDAPAQKIGKAVRAIIKPGPLKNALSGSWLGHALHPLLTDVTIGSFTSAVVLDWLGGDESEPAAERLIGLGLLSTLPTVSSGYSDWADTEVANEAVRRVGIVHAAGNFTAASLFAASWLARRRGDQGRGRALALAAAACWPAPPTSAATSPSPRASASTTRRSRTPPTTGPRCSTTPTWPTGRCAASRPTARR